MIVIKSDNNATDEGLSTVQDEEFPIKYTTYKVSVVDYVVYG